MRSILPESLKRPNIVAALWLVFGALLSIGIWVIFLFSAMPNGSSVVGATLDQLSFTFSGQNEHRVFFGWLALCPCLQLLAAYFYFIAKGCQRERAVVLLAVQVVLLGVNLAFVALPLAIVTLIPIYYGHRYFRCA